MSRRTGVRKPSGLDAFGPGGKFVIAVEPSV
jgi:hypothetical protein